MSVRHLLAGAAWLASCAAFAQIPPLVSAELTRAKNDTLTAQCGINWYNRRRDAGIYWTHCKSCGQLLHYTDDKTAKPQICAGRKP